MQITILTFIMKMTRISVVFNNNLYSEKCLLICLSSLNKKYETVQLGGTKSKATESKIREVKKKPFVITLFHPINNHSRLSFKLKHVGSIIRFFERMEPAEFSGNRSFSQIK